VNCRISTVRLFCYIFIFSYHFLGADFPIPLYVPKAKGAHCGGDSLREAEVRILQEREAEFVILADRNQCAGRIEALALS
jgi:hypothetical protein